MYFVVFNDNTYNWLPDIDMSDFKGTVNLDNLNKDDLIKKVDEDIKPRKKRINDIRICDIWLLVHMWIIQKTRIQRFEKVKTVYPQYKVHQKGFAFYHYLIDYYNEQFDEKLNINQMKERLKIITAKYKQLSALCINEALEHGVKQFPCLLFYDLFKLSNSNAVASFVSESRYVLLQRNSDKWKLLNANDNTPLAIHTQNHSNMLPALPNKIINHSILPIMKTHSAYVYVEPTCKFLIKYLFYKIHHNLITKFINLLYFNAF